MQIKRKNMLYLTISVTLILVLPLLSNIDPSSVEDFYTPVETSDDTSGSNQPNEAIGIYNASQYNVSEYALYLSRQTGLAIGDQNLTMEIPDNWDVGALSLDVPSVYETSEIFSAYGVPGDLSANTTRWDFVTSYEYQGNDEEPWAQFDEEYLINEERGRVTYNAGLYGYPTDYYGAANTSIPDFNKGSSKLEVGELIEEERSEAPVDTNGNPIDTEFFNDPEYDVLIDPYGGYRGSSKVSGEWISSIDALRNVIDSKWSLIYGYGQPSVAFGTPFYIPFEADTVSITYRWRVQNLGYEENDAMVVLSTIDNQLVNGTKGIKGEDYSSDTGGLPYLEYDYDDIYTPDISSHGYYERTFNITNLLGKYGYRTGWHYLDFGVGIFAPNAANDDVIIEWDSISINATHYDWYKAAHLQFDFLWEELDSGSFGSDVGPLAFSIYLGDLNTDIKDLDRIFLGYTTTFPAGSDWDDHIHVELEIPDRYEKAFEVDQFSFYIGMEWAGLVVGEPDASRGKLGRLTVDNIELQLNFNLGSPETLGLEMRINDGQGWREVNETNEIYTLITEPELNIEFQISGITDPYIRFHAFSLAYKYTINKAIASVSIDRFTDTHSFWNISYNNTQSMFEANANLSNSLFVAYTGKVENLPAFDGDGELSGDWNVTNLVSPYGFDATHYMEKESDNPYLQNVSATFEIWGGDVTPITGQWQVHAYQANYMINGTMLLDGGVSSEKYYNEDAAEYQLEFRNNTVFYGNYQVNMYNSSFNETTNFPTYHTNFDNNESVDWSVLDEGVGIYWLYSVFNDTNINNQTKRFGWYRDTFSVWRHVDYSIAEGAVGITVTSGDIATYNLQFDQTSVGAGFGIEDANIIAYNDASDKRWGKDWSPFVYLIDSITDNGGGSYTIDLKTVGVPVGSYTLYFTLFKAYHDFANTTTTGDTTGLTITGTTLTFDITYQEGAFEDSGNYYLESDNIPFVNDSKNSKIEVSLKDGASPLRDAYISATFLDTESAFMIAIEKYSLTFVEADKGIYILTLNTTFLHETSGTNETLSISYYRSGYTTQVHEIDVQVDAIPLIINAQPISPQYEQEEITIQGLTYLNSTGILVPHQDVNLNFTIVNATGQYMFGGTLYYKVSNVFESSIILMGENYLDPGNYILILNGTGTDLTESLSNEINFTIYPKFVTQLSITFPSEVRIGSYFSVSSRLTYANTTSIPNKELLFTINYSTTYSFQVLVETDSTGKGVYELIIPETYEGNDLTLYAQYFGTEILNSSENIKSQLILGKIPVNITFTESPTVLQVGYNATWEAQLSILYENEYEGRILTMYGFYDFDGNLSEPFLIRELATDENGTVSYTIEEIENNHNNISIYLEFQGDISIEDKFENVNSTILPKWNSNFQLVDFPDEMRLGQTVPIELTLNSSDPGFSESFNAMPIEIVFDYTSIKQEFLYYTDENGSLLYQVKIPDSGVQNLSYRIKFPGNSKIQPFEISGNEIILPKLMTSIDMESPSLFGTQRAGTFSYSATLTDSEGNPVPNVTIYFRIYNEENELIDSPFSQTNELGVAAISITLEQTGTYIISAQFDGHGIYATSSPMESTIEVVSNVMYYVRMLPYIGGAIGAIVAVGFIYQYAVVVPKRKKQLKSLKAIHQRFNDVENIQYILILTKSGLTVFSRSFTSVPIDENLISGFLSAISSFGKELGGRMKPGEKLSSDKGLEQLSYQQFKIIVNDAALVRTAVLLLKDASPTLKEKIKRFNLRFQEQYMDLLQNWSGQIPPEGPILEMVEQYLEVDLLYPHNINTSKFNEIRKTLDKKSINRKIIETGHNPPFGDIFYIRDIINTLRGEGEEDIHIFNGIIELRKEEAVFAINPRTQGLIDQFKPIIDQLSSDAKTLLLHIFDGAKTEKQLRRFRDVLDYNNAIAKLMQMTLINNDLSLTPTGEAVATILRLV